MSESGDDATARSHLVECIRHPDRGKRRLPAVVGLLEADDERTRLAAAWTCCLVALDHPDTVEYTVRRLGDRLADEEVTLELTHALDYLADRYPDQVEAVLTDLAVEAAESAERRDFPLPETGRFTRSHYYSHTPDRQGVGRVRLPGDGRAPDPRRIYTSGEPEEREIARRRHGDDDQGSTEDGAGSEGPGSGGPDRDESAPDSDTLGGRRSDVTTIAVRSRFDQLHVLATRDGGRYATNYRALVGQGNEERAVALRLLHRPDERQARPAFEEQLGEHLGRWMSIDDHAHVVSLLDWGLEPRPWLATAFPGETLVGQDLEYDRALSDAIALADAVACVHRHDVVHGGIDPKNVSYPGGALAATDQDPPLLNNVGLLAVYRYHTDPVTVLDPRFAAPEYYDRQFGRIDAATDIYQLGAVVYALVAGKPPFTGTFESVRAAVTGSEVAVPGDVVPDVPPALDEAVAKAMATRKLTRYETVEHFQQDLLAIRDGDRG